MAEFEVINKYFNFKQYLSSSIVKSIGDDCAILEISKNHQLVTSIDTLNEDVHFFKETAPEDIAYKALAVNVSDLLAMGARPLGFTLAISLPSIDDEWLASFSKGLEEACRIFDLNLIGGDTTQGDLSVTISVLGQVEKNKAVMRSGAKADDDIWITNTLGGARAALGLNEIECKNSQQNTLWTQLLHPNLPFEFSKELVGFATSAIDLSDGLLADLGHIIKQSKVGAEINIESIPFLEALIEEVGIEQARQFAIAGGDDYQLCFTANKNDREKIVHQANQTKTQVTRIGRMIGQELVLLLNGEKYSAAEESWQHFNQTINKS